MRDALGVSDSGLILDGSMGYKAVALKDENDRYEWFIRIENGSGSYSGIGGMNGEDEALAVCDAINYFFLLEATKGFDMLHPFEQEIITKLKSFV